MLLNIPNPELLITQAVFTFFSSVFFGQIVRRATDWFAFSPTHTSEQGKWLGPGDVNRWLLSGVFLLLSPAGYFASVLAVLFHPPPDLLLAAGVPGFADILKLALLMLLVLPHLGLYNFWQTIVRRWPDTFYSESAQHRIEEKHRSAFRSGRAQTVLIGCLWFFGPILCLVMVWCFGRCG